MRNGFPRRRLAKKSDSLKIKTCNGFPRRDLANTSENLSNCVTNGGVLRRLKDHSKADVWFVEEKASANSIATPYCSTRKVPLEQIDGISRDLTLSPIT